MTDEERRQQRRAYAKAWRARNPERRRQHERLYYVRHRERLKEYARSYKRRRRERASARPGYRPRVVLTPKQRVERTNAYQRKRRRDQAAKGLCARCTQPSVAGKKQCAVHLRYAAIWKREYNRRRRGASPRRG